MILLLINCYRNGIKLLWISFEYGLRILIVRLIINELRIINVRVNGRLGVEFLIVVVVFDELGIEILELGRDF